MPEVLYRLTYNATIDDAVDVSWRLANRTRAFRMQLQAKVICGGIGGGLVFFAGWMYVVGTSLLNVVLAVVAGTLFGIVFASIFWRFLEREIRKQQRKVVAEQFGGRPTIQSEIELRPDAVWVRQAGLETIFPWALCTGVQNNPNDIEMNFTPGICVIRNKHFTSPDERQAFLDTARRLSANPTNPT